MNDAKTSQTAEKHSMPVVYSQGNLLVMMKKEEALSVYYRPFQLIFHLPVLYIVNKTLSSWQKWGDAALSCIQNILKKEDAGALPYFFSLCQSSDNFLKFVEKSRIHLPEKKRINPKCFRKRQVLTLLLK